MARTGNLKAARVVARPARPAAPPRRLPAVLERVLRYLREVRTELSRVDWPSRRELVGSTTIVVVVLVVLALYLGFWDYLFTVGVRRWIIGPVP